MEVSGVTAEETREQFLQLLVTQLQNQDPLDPINQEDFLSQLAQFSTLEGIENLGSVMSEQVQIQKDSLRYQELTQAATLVGKRVVYEEVTKEGEAEERSGIVTGVRQAAGTIEFQIGDNVINWNAIQSISASAPPENISGIQTPRDPVSSHADAFVP